jgi:Zn-dependent protease
MVIGRLFGIEIRASRSWIFVLGFVTLTMVSQFEHFHPGWGAATAIVAGVVMAVLFFGSVVVHELSHCLVARRFGIQARSISLNFFGGLSYLSRQAERPGEEFAFSIAGPLANLVLGGIFFGLGLLLAPYAEVASVIAQRTGYVNLILAVFNLVPGAPLDGGRVLRSIVWKMTASYERGTLVASVVGQAVGALVMMLGLAITFTGELTGLLVGMVGYYLLVRARSSLGEVALRRALEGLTVRNLWLDSLPPIERATTLTDFLRQLAPSPTADPHFMVVDGGVIWGLLPASRVLRIDARKWDDLSVGDVMTPIDQLEKLSFQTDIMRAMEAVLASETSELPVIDGNEVQGFVGRDAIMRFVASRLTANG